jgi:hypothetical protein
MRNSDRQVAESAFDRKKRRDSETNDALKQEHARHDAAMKNLQPSARCGSSAMRKIKLRVELKSALDFISFRIPRVQAAAPFAARPTRQPDRLRPWRSTTARGGIRLPRAFSL